MNDMSAVIIPKSDQINADDLIAGPMTITIREVQIRGGQEQPVSIFFDGSDKAYRPCKSMSRVLVQGWGADANKYVGRSLTLYRDPTVKWAGLEVGGIRISHMSHIDGEKLMMLTATKGSRKPHKVYPLVVEQQPNGTDTTAARKFADKFLANVGRAPDQAKLEAYVTSKAADVALLADQAPDIHAEVMRAIADKRVSFIAEDDDEPFAEPAPDTPVINPTGAIAGLNRRIDEATDGPTLDEIEVDIGGIEMPDDEREALVARVEARKAELEEAN